MFHDWLDVYVVKIIKKRDPCPNMMRRFDRYVDAGAADFNRRTTLAEPDDYH